jgi:hypothetical protein
MPLHQLRLKQGRRGEIWSLEWDSLKFKLTDPEGHVQLVADTAAAYHAVNPSMLIGERKIAFVSPFVPLEFRRNRAAVSDLKQLVGVALQDDETLFQTLYSSARRDALAGTMMFAIGASLFAMGCWAAFSVPDPPKVAWVRLILLPLGMAFHFVMLISLALATYGPCLCISGLRQWRWIRANGR